MKLTKKLTSKLIEAAIFAEGKPISVEKLRKVLPRGERPPLGEVREVIENLQKHYSNRGVQLVEVASGYRFQICDETATHLLEQKEEKPMRMSKAFMETLALAAYRQPITRGEIEDIRGVAVSSNIIKSLLELEWIREVGHKDVPGKPALFATTKKFLDFFNLKSLGDLPPLAELQALSETRLEEEFDQLNEALGHELAEKDKEEMLRANSRQNFMGPMPQPQELDEDAPEVVAHDNEEDLIDVEAQDAQDESLEEHADSEIQDDVELEENMDVEMNSEVVDEDKVVVDLHPEMDDEDNDDVELSSEFEEQQNVEVEVSSEIENESVELIVEKGASNHRPLEDFSEIVLTQASVSVDDDNADDIDDRHDANQAVGDDE